MIPSLLLDRIQLLSAYYGTRLRRARIPAARNRRRRRSHHVSVIKRIVVGVAGATVLAGATDGLDPPGGGVDVVIAVAAATPGPAQRRQQDAREQAREERLDGGQAGAGDGHVDLEQGPARDDDRVAVRARIAVKEQERPHERDDADADGATPQRMLAVRPTDGSRRGQGRAGGGHVPEGQEEDKVQRHLLPARDAELVEHGQGQGEDEEVGPDVNSGVAPIDAEGMAIGGGFLREVPEGVEWNADGEEGGEDPGVRDQDDAQQYLGCQADVAVVDGAEVEAEDRDLDKDQGEDVDDVDGPGRLQRAGSVNDTQSMDGNNTTWTANLQVSDQGFRGKPCRAAETVFQFCASRGSASRRVYHPPPEEVARGF